MPYKSILSTKKVDFPIIRSKIRLYDRKNLKTDPGRPDLYNADTLRKSIVRRKNPQSTKLFLEVYIGELIERKYRAFPDPLGYAIKYCLDNLDALVDTRPHPKLITARYLLIEYGIRMGKITVDPLAQSIAS